MAFNFDVEIHKMPGEYVRHRRPTVLLPEPIKPVRQIQAAFRTGPDAFIIGGSFDGENPVA